MHTRLLCLVSLVVAASFASCGGSSSSAADATPPCEQDCQDKIVGRSIRESIRFAFNLLLEGGKVGMQDAIGPCPQGGKVHVTGTATSDADTGTNILDLNYEFDGCGTIVTGTGRDTDYELTLQGTVHELGKISNVAGSTTAIEFTSNSFGVSGTVSSPVVKVEETCKVSLKQDGNALSGMICDRTTGFSF